MRIPVFIIALFLLISYGNQELSEFDFLEGTWKIENKEQFEVWEKENSQNLTGYSYRITSGQKTVTETLSITKVGDQIIYEATVPDQNDGRSIPFILQVESDSFYSFENEKHDFPKKIQYQRINDHQLKVNVLGENDQGFSYILTKQ